jgi:hypothetical protein
MVLYISGASEYLASRNLFYIKFLEENDVNSSSV